MYIITTEISWRSGYRGKNINLSLSLEDYSDGIGGNAPVDKADDFFSYLYFDSVTSELLKVCL